MLAGADEVARQVIRQLLAEDFAKLRRPPPPYSEEFAAICLDNVYNGPDLAEDDGREPA